jgi:hypothetical protein
MESQHSTRTKRDWGMRGDDSTALQDYESLNRFLCRSQREGVDAGIGLLMKNSLAVDRSDVQGRSFWVLKDLLNHNDTTSTKTQKEKVERRYSCWCSPKYGTGSCSLMRGGGTCRVRLQNLKYLQASSI